MSQTKTNKPTFIDLFAGCGGLSLGFEQAGFVPVFVNDIDERCLKTYALNRTIDKERIVCSDINDILKSFDDYSPLFPNVDLVAGGPPCQGFSNANRQRILDDPRNRLYKAYIQFLSRVRPKIFVMENVRGMMNKIDEILGDFKRYLGPDYSLDYSVLNAVDFGVPQYRQRFILIGCRNGTNPSDVFEQIKEKSKIAPKFVLFDAIGDLPPLCPNTKKNRSDIENDEVGYTKVKYEYSRTPFFEFLNIGNYEIDYLYNHKNRYNNPRDIEIFKRLPQGGNSLHESIRDIMPYKSRDGIFKDKYFKLEYNKPCKTITSHMSFDCNMYIHPTQARGLSPREAARIQTFPDDFVFTGSRNNWYKQIGNAVPVKLAQAIAEVLIKCL